MKCDAYPDRDETDIDSKLNAQQLLEQICGGRIIDSAHYRIPATIIVDSAPLIAVELHEIGVGVLPAKRPISCDALIGGGRYRVPGNMGKFDVSLDLPPAECDLDIVTGPFSGPDGSRQLPWRPAD